jgi:fructose-1,6-bisphosphatase/inositol monophosphatase family enzyme
MFLAHDGFFKHTDWNYSFCRVLMACCAVVDLCWPAIGRVCGSIFKAHIWDFAGSWPIFKKAGLDLRSVETGAVADRLHEDLFKQAPPSPWQLKKAHILSSERNFPIIKANMSPRK